MSTPRPSTPRHTRPRRAHAAPGRTLFTASHGRGTHAATADTVVPTGAPTGASSDAGQPGRTRTVVRRSLLAAGAAGLAAVPVTAALLAETPQRAVAEAPHLKPVALVQPGPDGLDPALSAAGSQAAVLAVAEIQAEQQAAAAAAAAQAAAAAAIAAAAERAAQEQAAAEQASRERALAAADPRTIAQQLLAQRGWSGQYSCLNSLWTRESGWSTTADNPSSDAYGIPQALPGSKMASAGADWRTNPVTQITWGLSYIASTYGSPCGAWGHSQATGWY